MSLAHRLARHTSNANAAPRRSSPFSEDTSKRPASIAMDLVPRIIQQDCKSEASRTKGDDYLHVSALIHTPCTRRVVLEQLARTPAEKRTYPATRVMWALGRAAETHVRAQYIESVKASGVMGRWVCPCGALEQEPLFNKHVKCAACKHPAHIYRELALMDHDARICGSPDIALCAADNLIVPVECKSMNLAEFKERGGEDKKKDFKPNNNHVTQVACYHRMAGQIYGAERMATYALVLYVCKDHPRFGVIPYRTAFVAMNDPAVINAQDRVWELAADVWQARKRGRLPAKLNVCAVATSPTAKACPMIGECFASRQ